MPAPGGGDFVKPADFDGYARLARSAGDFRPRTVHLPPACP